MRAARQSPQPHAAAPPSPPRQALTLRRIALYFDTDAKFWVPEAAWRDLAPHDWDEWFLPGVRCAR